MKLRVLDLLVCPIDKTPLKLIEWESVNRQLDDQEINRARRVGLDPKSLATEIITGLLLNPGRRIFYPIYQGIPRLIVFKTGLSEKFWQLFGDRINREMPGFLPADENSNPGEMDVLRTFSSEWRSYGWNEQAYWNLTPKEMYQAMGYMLDLKQRPIKDQLVLEVGIGIGGIADYMAQKQESELVGLDLGYSVDAAYKYFGQNKFLHIVQASAFAAPFREATFDLVYSHGVLHHTFSTKKAFDSVSKLPKIGGRLYILVYNPSSERRNFTRRALMLLENMIRPICWRLPEKLQTIVLSPIMPLYIIHQNLIVRRKQASYARYGWREAHHAARDRFTPRFAYRHSDEEVQGWFCAAGYVDLQGFTKQSVPAFVPEGFIVSTGVQGIRRS